MSKVTRGFALFSDRDNYCNHQYDLEQRALFYARSIQASRYYPFGTKNQPKTPLVEAKELAPLSRNQQQAQEARDRIRQAVSDLAHRHALPTQATARRHTIRSYGIGNQTLDKYKELWHPEHLKLNQEGQYHPVKELDTSSKSLESNQEGQYHPITTNKFVTSSAAPQGQADGPQEVEGAGVFSTGALAEVANQQRIRTEKHVAKMQVWLAGDDPILKAEAEQYFAALSVSEQVSFAADSVQVEPHTGFLIEGVSMPGGFGKSQPKRRGGKTGLQEIQQLGKATKPPSQEPQPDLVMQAEVEVAFTQYRQENLEEVALAWSLGVYNPLANVDLLAVGARFLEPEEEDWLAIARMIEWLDVEDSLDAIYFTAPPPDFALEQADWYVRPDLTSFLEEPILLREVIHLYPIPLQKIQGAIADRFLQLGWTSQQQAQFMLKLFEKPQTELTEDDWEFLLFELDSQVQDSSEW